MSHVRGRMVATADGGDVECSGHFAFTREALAESVAAILAAIADRGDRVDDIGQTMGETHIE